VNRTIVLETAAATSGTIFSDNKTGLITRAPPIPRVPAKTPARYELKANL